tara:strand:+ start:14418 stop:16286 length:1869 start_codon:yes stop_codon:yes gene_type:complete
MKKRGIFSVISIIIFLTIIQTAFSIYEESVYSGSVEDGDSVEIDGHLFEFVIEPISSKVVVKIDISGVIVSNGECKIKSNFDICISNVSFSYRNLTTYRDVYKAIVNIYQIKSKIDITHTLSKSNILIDEEADAQLSIENTADIVAEDVLATIKLPSSVLATELEGCKKTFDSIVFDEDVHPGQIKTCTYKIRGLSGGDFELAANVTYFNGIEKVSATSTTIEGQVYNSSLKISSKLNKSRFDIGEKMNLTINIKNMNGEHDLRITTFRIKIPQNLLLIKKPKEALRTNDILSWSGSLSTNEDKDFLIQLQAKRSGNHTIVSEASYKISKFLRTAKGVSNVEVYCDCPHILYDFSEQLTLPGQKTNLRALLTNPSKILVFKNIKIDYNTNIPNVQDFSTTHTDIKSLESIKIFDSQVIGPNIDESYNFNITAIYESANQIFVQRENIIIKIPDKKEPIIEEPLETEEQEVVEEQVTDTVLGDEEVEEDTEESEEEIDVEEPIITTVDFEKKNSSRTYLLIAIIGGIAFVLIILAIFKKRGNYVNKVAYAKKPQSKTTIEPEKRSIKELLHLDLLKKPDFHKESEGQWEKDEDYKELERQINRIGISPEGQTKKSLFGRFKRK